MYLWRHLLVALLLKALVLIQVWVLGLSAGNAVITFTRMLVTCTLYSVTSISLYRQSSALLHALDIYLNVILYVSNSNDQSFTLLLTFFSVKELLQGLVIIALLVMLQTLEVIVPLGYSA